ncbi:hypothetical protein, partial [Burkholderia sp. BCC1993]|uniref:hypothetical protein n=1 Tax=Burkholderia sp. BCC1993 TaxID=2817444 RepID=UPI002AAF10EA
DLPVHRLQGSRVVTRCRHGRACFIGACGGFMQWSYVSRFATELWVSIFTLRQMIHPDHVDLFPAFESTCRLGIARRAGRSCRPGSPVFFTAAVSVRPVISHSSLGKVMS